ncbi:caspase-related protein [Streptomyces carminius]|uniref:Caspase-related protein n=1 Tax=Streptomyces carminius TaxID=2665496 RepID=A0A2M8LS27_9ACTN|nr:caspase family protein [Streptomyces carminius]PJE94773.1 caspase-related protein [Streptomyces carminius]
MSASRSGSRPAARSALVVANDDYRDEGLRGLLSPSEDAVALAGVLGDPRIGGFDVRVVRNEPSHSISMHIEDFFADRKPGDSLILHFSGHGLKNASGDLFFAAPNTAPQRLASTAVAADFVRRCMAACRARSIVLFLDCCYGGAFSQGMGVRAAGDVNVLDAFGGEKLGGGRGWAVITASNSMEYAFEGTELTEGGRPRPSVFTSALVNGLATGEADLDEDGRVSLNELYEYVFDRVRERNPHQTPSRTVDLQGEVYVARSERRKIRAAPLPEDLRTAVSSENSYTRRGAIAELRFRMENPDLAVAAGAREALAALARNDVRSIADEAGRALAEVAPNPSPAVLDFGRVPQHSPAPHRTVGLLGPPLARSCTPHPKESWIRVTDGSEGHGGHDDSSGGGGENGDVPATRLDVSVDTSRPGPLDGTLSLKGITGEAAVRVRAEVVPVSTGRERAQVPPPVPTPAQGRSGAPTAARAPAPPAQAPPPVPQPPAPSPPATPPAPARHGATAHAHPAHSVHHPGAPPGGPGARSGASRWSGRERLGGRLPPAVRRLLLPVGALLACVASAVFAGQAAASAVRAARNISAAMNPAYGQGAEFHWALGRELDTTLSLMAARGVGALLLAVLALVLAGPARKVLRTTPPGERAGGKRTAGAVLTTLARVSAVLLTLCAVLLLIARSVAGILG